MYIQYELGRNQSYIECRHRMPRAAEMGGLCSLLLVYRPVYIHTFVFVRLHRRGVG